MNFVINVADKIATVVDAPVIICGNSDYVIDFTFDSEWDDYEEKTARFKFKKDGKKGYIDVLFSGTQCNVPILSDIDMVEIGVYAGNLSTTTGAKVDCERSILCGGNTPYNQNNYGSLVSLRDVNATFANALKGTAIGEAVSMKDVSPLEHSIVVELKSDTITDFSSVTLKKYGKNLLDLTSLIGKSVTANGGTLSCGADGGISGSGTVSGYVGFDPFRLYLPKGKYILSASGTFSNISCAIILNDENGKVLQEAGVVSSGGGFSFNTENYPSFAYITVTIKRNNNVALSGTAYFQIELGTKATEYEPFKEPETYNGTVESVPSLYPTTTLLTDTAGVTITAEYNRDLNKAFENLKEELKAELQALILEV